MVAGGACSRASTLRNNEDHVCEGQTYEIAGVLNVGVERPETLHRVTAADRLDVFLVALHLLCKRGRTPVNLGDTVESRTWEQGCKCVPLLHPMGLKMLDRTVREGWMGFEESSLAEFLVGTARVFTEGGGEDV